LARGLDDTLLFESDRTYDVVDLFSGNPSSVLDVTGARRSSGTVGGREVTLVRKSDGWVLTTLGRTPSAAPPVNEAG
jgi:hypothetical protein